MISNIEHSSIFTTLTRYPISIKASKNHYTTTYFYTLSYTLGNVEIASLEKANMASRQNNLDRLNHLTNLADKGWNGYESEPINQEAIKNAINIVNKVVVQPKIFPLANGNIQLEYYNRDKDMEYLELEVSENGIQDSTNENISIKELNTKLKEFYGFA